MATSPYLRHSAVARALLATGVLYFVLDLSAGDRGVVDYLVIGAVAVAILWNLVALSRHMYAGGGPAALWRTLRTTLFWIVGLLNTVWIRPEDVGTWKNWVGVGMLAVAILDTIVLARQERRLIRAHAAEHASG